MQDSDFNMQHNYVDIQRVCNQLRIKKKISNIAQTQLPTCNMLLIYDAIYSC